MRTLHRLAFLLAAATPLVVIGCGGSHVSAGVPNPAAESTVPLRIELSIAGTTDSTTARCAWLQIGLTGAGQGPVLGQSTFVSSHCITRGERPYLPAYDGRAVLTAAGGDQIRFSYEITDLTTPPPMQLTTGTFTLTAGTGRFAGATGGGVFQVRVDKSKQPWVGWVVLEGQIGMAR